MRKATCNVTLPATGVDKTEILQMPRLIMFFTSFDAFILPLEKSSEVEKRDRHVCTGVPSAGGDVYHSRRDQRKAVVHKAASHIT